MENAFNDGWLIKEEKELSLRLTARGGII